MTRSGAVAESEFVFELRVCAWAERHWPPSGDLDDDTVVMIARQLGTRSRRWDTIVIEADCDALAERVRFGPRRLDSDLLGVVRNAPENWTYYRNALPHPDYPWRYVREAVNRAADRGIIERRKRANRIEIRRRWPYPEWVKRIVAIENKPDLDASAARALTDQIQRDVALGLADEVWVATRATDERIEPVLFEDLPTEAGVLAFDDGDGDSDGNDDGGSDGGGDDSRSDGSGGAAVVWHPRRLAADEPGTRITERPSGASNDRSGARFEYMSPEEKNGKRRALCERAYERGWRSYIDSMRSDCKHFSLYRDRAGRAPGAGAPEDETPAPSDRGGLLPYCSAKERPQTAAECAGSCSEFEPEPPAWRTRGWPIEGGPGAATKRLLAARRRRRRPELDGS